MIKTWREWLFGTDVGMAVLLFVAISSVYFSTITGVTSSNDGSSYAAVRAIVERGTFEISPFIQYTEKLDYAKVGSRNYSDRPPATALLASATYALGQILPPQIVMLPSKHDPTNPRLAYAVGAASLAMAGAVILFFLSLRRAFGVSAAGAVVASLTLALGTTSWKYGSMLYPHAASALMMWGGLFLIFEAERRDAPTWAQLLGIGFFMSAAILAEYTGAIFAVAAGLYVLYRFGPAGLRGLRAPETRAAWLARCGALAVGVLSPLIFLAIYNAVNFGGPFVISSYLVDLNRWPNDRSILTQFTTSLDVGLPALMVYGDNNQGLFLLTPIALLAFVGFVDLFRRSRAHLALLLGMFVVYLCLVSSHDYYNPLTNDSRYLTPYLGVWFVPVALALDRLIIPAGLSRVRSALAAALAFGLIWLSVRNQIMVIAFSWNYALDPTKLLPQAIPPENIALIAQTVFRNAPNLPLLWLLEGIGAALAGGVALIARRLKTARSVEKPETAVTTP